MPADGDADAPAEGKAAALTDGEAAAGALGLGEAAMSALGEAVPPELMLEQARRENAKIIAMIRAMIFLLILIFFILPFEYIIDWAPKRLSLFLFIRLLQGG